MKRFFHSTVVLVILLLCIPAREGVQACTSAVVGGDLTLNGGVLLWKHRDSGHKDNFVARVEPTDSTLAYVALFNAGDNSLAEAWIGFNEAGFAVMNTASYNLAPDTAVVKDREGLIMSRALANCRTVDDFLKVLDREIASAPEGAGVQANFGVADSEGTGMYVEMSDHRYTCYPLSAAADNVMIRSNYSYSGGTEGRLGEVRHDDAVRLFEASVARGPISAETFIEGFSRSFYHAGVGKDMLADTDYHMLTDKGEYIPRRSSCASVVIEGCASGGDPSTETVMWVAIGYPALSVPYPVTLDSIPAQLQRDPQSGRSPYCDEVNRMRDKAYPRKGKEGKWLIDAGYLRSRIPQAAEEARRIYRFYRDAYSRRSVTSDSK